MKQFAFAKVDNFRYERKFYITEMPTEEIESMLKFHPAIFKEIYYGRFINNIYFDTFNLMHYFESVEGVSSRMKVRIRWYNDLFGFIEKPILELKLKRNLHVGKLFYPLKPFIFDNNFSINTIRKILKESVLNDILYLNIRELKFSLLNRYKRKYFLSSNRKYRITIDNNLQSYALSPHQNNFLHKFSDYSASILELKYNDPHDGFVQDITNYFPFRLTKSSKYVEGINKLFYFYLM